MNKIRYSSGRKFSGIAQGWSAFYKIGKAITSNFNLEEILSLIAKIA